MPKICNHENCKHPVFGGGYCKYHQFLRNKPPKQIKPQRAIPRTSTKRKKESEEYKLLRFEFLGREPLCKANLDNCTKIATEVHHMKGRIGKQYCPLAA